MGKEEFNILDFTNTYYNKEITNEEIIRELKGIIKRVIGEQYICWFQFYLSSDNRKDYFEISNNEDTIKIAGNNGVSIASGINYYLKYFCNVHISQCGKQIKMPKNPPKLEKTIKKESNCELRYAYNYCTHSYSMAFWGYKQWQEELDWLALNGVNLVLDLTAQEEVWRRFLNSLGYSNKEVKEWLVGPAYIAWQHMCNMSNFGGNLPDKWFKSRVDLARRIHRKMKILGMSPVLQGYSGMIPINIKEKIKNISIISQGQWNHFNRPWMVETDSEDFDNLALLFYKCQSEVYGKSLTHYYATDPFHEGGNRGGLDESIVYKEVLESLLDFDKEGIWVIQSWGANPTQQALDGIRKESRKHLLILDLYSEVDPRYSGKSEIWGYEWDNPEFDETPWIWNMLNNFGGRMGLNGNIQVLADDIVKAKNHCKFMKGIGITPEATGTNPILFDILFEMVWNDKEIDLNIWIEGYINRRYGKITQNSTDAWQIFRETVYKTRKDYHEGAPESIINARPDFNIKSASTWGSIKITYNKKYFMQGVKLLADDFEFLNQSDGYLFDLVDCLRQVLSNSAQEYYEKFIQFYKKNNLELFIKYSNIFLEIIELQDKVLSTRKEFLLGTWIKNAKEISFDLESKKIFEINAKALITTWGNYEQSESGQLHDYSNRQWSGLTGDFYYKRWDIWIKLLRESMKKQESLEEFNWFNWEWAWVNREMEYNIEPLNYNIKELATKVFNIVESK